MNLFFAGDTIFPKEKVTIDKSLLNVINKGTFYANLEIPVLNDDSQPKKTTYIDKILGNYRLFSKANDIHNYPDIKTEFSISNNHIGDQGKRGILSSIELVSNSTHTIFKDPFKIITLEDKRILIYQCNLVNPQIYKLNINVFNSIYNGIPYSLKSIVRLLPSVTDYDLAIRIIHLGRVGKSEINERTMNKIKKISNTLSSFTPHIVIGHHSQQLGKIYELQELNTLIFSSLGNFIFEEELGKFSQDYYYNAIVKVSSEMKCEILPIKISDSRVSLLDKNDETISSLTETEQRVFNLEKIKYGL